MSEKNSLIVEVILLTIIGVLIVGGMLIFGFLPERNGLLAYCSGMASAAFVALATHWKTQSEKLQRATYLLSNSHYGIALRVAMIATKNLSLNTQDPDDIEAAAIAREQYEEHQRKQKIVDAGGIAEVAKP